VGVAHYYFTAYESGAARAVRSRQEVATLLAAPSSLLHLRLIAPEESDWRWLGKTFALPPAVLEHARQDLNRAHLGRHKR
jgi:Mg2+ and Co2+ transporter CorA